MTISLRNTSGRLLVFVLGHETYCRALGECACDVEPGRAARRLPRSITLATSVTSPELDEAVLEVPEVVRATRRGELAVKRRVADSAEPARSEPIAATSPSEVSDPSDATRAKKKRGAG